MLKKPSPESDLKFKSILFGSIRSKLELTAERGFSRQVSGYCREFAEATYQSGLLTEFVSDSRRLKRYTNNLHEFRELSKNQLSSKIQKFFVENFRSPHLGRLLPLHEKTYRNAYELGAISGILALGGSPSIFKLSDTEILSRISQRTLQFKLWSEKQLTTDIIDFLVKCVCVDWLNPLETKKALYSGVLASRNVTGRWARTEIQCGLNCALFDIGSRSGITKKTWEMVSEISRQRHVDNNAQGVLHISQPFSSGQMHPGQGSYVVNCRCYLGYVFDSPRETIWDGSPGPYQKLE